MPNTLSDLSPWEEVERLLREKNTSDEEVDRYKRGYWDLVSSSDEVRDVPPVKLDARKSRFFGVPVDELQTIGKPPTPPGPEAVPSSDQFTSEMAPVAPTLNLAPKTPAPQREAPLPPMPELPPLTPGGPPAQQPPVLERARPITPAFTAQPTPMVPLAEPPAGERFRQKSVVPPQPRTLPKHLEHLGRAAVAGTFPGGIEEVINSFAPAMDSAASGMGEVAARLGGEASRSTGENALKPISGYLHDLSEWSVKKQNEILEQTPSTKGTRFASEAGRTVGRATALAIELAGTKTPVGRVGRMAAVGAIHAATAGASPLEVEIAAVRSGAMMLAFEAAAFGASPIKSPYIQTAAKMSGMQAAGTALGVSQGQDIEQASLDTLPWTMMSLGHTLRGAARQSFGARQVFSEIVGENIEGEGPPTPNDILRRTVLLSTRTPTSTMGRAVVKLARKESETAKKTAPELYEDAVAWAQEYTEAERLFWDQMKAFKEAEVQREKVKAKREAPGEMAIQVEPETLKEKTLREKREVKREPAIVAPPGSEMAVARMEQVPTTPPQEPVYTPPKPSITMTEGEKPIPRKMPAITLEEGTDATQGRIEEAVPPYAGGEARGRAGDLAGDRQGVPGTPVPEGVTGKEAKEVPPQEVREPVHELPEEALSQEKPPLTEKDFEPDLPSAMVDLQAAIPKEVQRPTSVTPKQKRLEKAEFDFLVDGINVHRTKLGYAPLQHGDLEHITDPVMIEYENALNDLSRDLFEVHAPVYILKTGGKGLHLNGLYNPALDATFVFEDGYNKLTSTVVHELSHFLTKRFKHLDTFSAFSDVLEKTADLYRYAGGHSIGQFNALRLAMIPARSRESQRWTKAGLPMITAETAVHDTFMAEFIRRVDNTPGLTRKERTALVGTGKKIQRAAKEKVLDELRSNFLAEVSQDPEQFFSTLIEQARDSKDPERIRFANEAAGELGKFMWNLLEKVKKIDADPDWSRPKGSDPQSLRSKGWKTTVVDKDYSSGKLTVDVHDPSGKLQRRIVDTASENEALWQVTSGQYSLESYLKRELKRDLDAAREQYEKLARSAMEYQYEVSQKSKPDYGPAEYKLPGEAVMQGGMTVRGPTEDRRAFERRLSEKAPKPPEDLEELRAANKVPPPVVGAKLQDVERDTEGTLKNRPYIVVTSNKQGRDPKKNAAADRKLRARLDDMGLEYIPAPGNYGYPEDSYIIFEAAGDQAVTLGRQFKQESVVVNDPGGKSGLYYTTGKNAGKYNPYDPQNVKIGTAEEIPEFYTEFSGKRFQHQVDFDQLLDQPPARYWHLTRNLEGVKAKGIIPGGGPGAGMTGGRKEVSLYEAGGKVIPEELVRGGAARPGGGAVEIETPRIKALALESPEAQAIIKRGELLTRKGRGPGTLQYFIDQAKKRGYDGFSDNGVVQAWGKVKPSEFKRMIEASSPEFPAEGELLAQDAKQGYGTQRARTAMREEREMEEFQRAPEWTAEDLARERQFEIDRSRRRLAKREDTVSILKRARGIAGGPGKFALAYKRWSGDLPQPTGEAAGTVRAFTVEGFARDVVDFHPAAMRAIKDVLGEAEPADLTQFQAARGYAVPPRSAFTALMSRPSRTTAEDFLSSLKEAGEDSFDLIRKLRNNPLNTLKQVIGLPDGSRQEVIEGVKNHIRSNEIPFSAEGIPMFQDALRFPERRVETKEEAPVTEEDTRRALEAEDRGVRLADEIARRENDKDLGLGVDLEAPFIRVPDEPSLQDAQSGPQPKHYVIPEEMLWDRIRKNIQDKYLWLKKTQEAVAEQAGNPIEEAADVYLGQELAGSRTSARQRENDETLVKPLGAQMNRAAKLGLSVKDVEDFLYARHAGERNSYIATINPEFSDAGSGMETTEAAAILAGRGSQRYGVTSFSQKQLAQLKNVGDHLDKITGRRLSLMESYGLISHDAANTLRARWKYYVPLKGIAGNDEIAGVRGLGVGKGFDVRGQESKRALGRESMATDIIANAMADLETTVMRGEHNLVGNRFYNFVYNHPDPALWEINKVVNNRMLRNGQVIDVPQLLREDPRVFSTKIDGKEHLITIHHPELAAALKELNPVKAGAALRAFAKVNRYLAAVNTSLNPGFLFSNLARDVQTAGINLSAEETKGFASAAMMNVPRAIKGSWSVLRDRNASGEYEDYFKEFEKAGGKTDWANIYSLEEAAKNVEAMMKDKSQVKEGLLSLKKFMEDANSAIENGTRLSAYVEARKRGWSKDSAASLAKNLTVNFERKGVYGQAINSLYLFSNASLQGTARIFQAAYHSPAVRGVLAAITATQFGLAMLSRSIGGKDDDDVDYYDRVPSWVKERNIVVMRSGTKGKYYKIPLPYGYNIPAVAGMVAENMVNGRDKNPWHNAGSLFNAAWGSFNPISGGSVSFSPAGLVQLISPTVIRPLVDIAVNRDFAGRNIHSAPNPFDLPEPKYTHPWRGTEPVYTSIAKALNDVTGGDDVKPGSLNASGEDIKYAMGAIGGGLGQLFQQTGALPFREGELRSYQIPIGSRFMGEQWPGIIDREFNAQVNELEYAKDKLARALETGDTTRWDALTEQYGDVIPYIRQGIALRTRLAKMKKDPKNEETVQQFQKEFLAKLYGAGWKVVE